MSNQTNMELETTNGSKQKAEMLMAQTFNDWNNLKRCLTLSESSNVEVERLKYMVEFHKALLSCELRLRSLQKSIREIQD